MGNYYNMHFKYHGISTNRVLDVIHAVQVINPRRMREGYGSRSVCLSVTTLAAIYLVCKSKMRSYRVPYGIEPNS